MRVRASSLRGSAVATPAKTKAYFAQKFDSHMGAGMGGCTFSIIPVDVRMKNCINTVSMYAFLDNGSTVNFCSEGLMNRLGARGKKIYITVDTMGKSHNMSGYAISNLEVCDLQSVHSVQLNSIYTKDTIPASPNHIPNEEDLLQWPHLDGIIDWKSSSRCIYTHRNTNMPSW